RRYPPRRSVVPDEPPAASRHDPGRTAHDALGGPVLDVEGGDASGARDPLDVDRFAAPHAAPGVVGRADVGGDLDVPADPCAARHDGTLAHDRDAGVEP